MLKLLALLWLLLILFVGGLLFFLGYATTVPIVGPEIITAEPMYNPNLVEIAEGDGRFTTLLTAVDAAGLRETLEGQGPFTIFAPTDEAFAALPAGTLDSILADTPLLTNILLYHAIAGEVNSDNVRVNESLTMLNGEQVIISQDADGNVFINQAQIIIVDIPASNGVIHVIDAVLIPSGD